MFLYSRRKNVDFSLLQVYFKITSNKTCIALNIIILAEEYITQKFVFKVN